MIDRLSKAECCGCNACGDACPKGSISFVKDDELIRSIRKEIKKKQGSGMDCLNVDV